MLARLRLPALLVACVAIALMAGACKHAGRADLPARAEPAGEPRPFLLGVSSVPQQPTDDAYRAAFRFAAQAGEVIMIQRAPAWADFLPGAQISDRLERLTRFERDLARDYGLKVFLAVDPTDPADRGRLAGLPEDLAGRDFSDGRVRSAFIAYAKYLALNYKPAFMALGVEMDMFFNRRGDSAFRNFQSLYFQAYDAVKDASPGTQVFPTFQYESLRAVLSAGEQSQPAWALVARFEPKLDAVAISSFPGFAYGTIDRVPQDYFAELSRRFQKPLIFASVGWPSGQTGDVSQGSDIEQASFIRRTMAEAERMDVRLVVWYLGQDVSDPPTAAFRPLATMGLYRSDGRAKPAWLIWRTYVGRPIVIR